MEATYYIAGPMSGTSGFNYAAFYRAEEALTKQGFNVINPARLDEDGLPDGVHREDLDWKRNHISSLTRARFLRRDLHELTRCDGIVMLPGWESSTGATVEYVVARATAMPVYEFVDGFAQVPAFLPEPQWHLLFNHIGDLFQVPA